MAVVFRSSVGSNNAGGGTTIVMTVPTVVNNDVMIMMISARGGTGTTITTPAGWTLLGTAVNSTTVLKQAIYFKVASSEPASYTVTLTSNKASGIICSLYGSIKTTPLAVQYSAQVNASSATVSAATLGAFGSSKNGLDLFFGGTATGTTVSTNPSGYTGGASATSSGGSVATRTTSYTAYQSLTGVSTVGAISGSFAAAAVNIGHHIFIYEDASPTIVLNTTDGITFTTSTPSVEFTGTDPEASGISYEIEISKNQTGFVDITGLGFASYYGVTVNSSNGDLYIAVNETGGFYAIYKQTGGIGSFVSISGAVSFLPTSLAINETNGDIYVTGSQSDIYKQTGGVGSFVGVGQSNRDWSGIAINSTTGDVFASVYNGDVYKQTAGTGSFVALGQTVRFWNSLAINQSNGDLYGSVNTGDIYKMAGGAGSFVAQNQASRFWNGITVDSSTGDVYVGVDGEDVFKQTAGTGNFLPLGETARTWRKLAFDSLNGHLYGNSPSVLTKKSKNLLYTTSTSDAGFLNTVTPANLNPFTSGNKVSYTIQAINSLPNLTYYYRVRAIDTLGSNQYSSFSTSRTFIVNAAQVQSSTKTFAMLGVG